MKYKTLWMPVFLLFFFHKSFATGIPDTTLNKQDDSFAEFANPQTLNTSIKVWPNPAKNYVMVSVNSLQPGETGETILYNFTGIPCALGHISNGINEIDTGNLESGIYMLEILTQNKLHETRRLVIKH